MGTKFTQKATSSKFLQERIKLNKNATNNFDHWSINCIPNIKINSKILDLGCGTGKQIDTFSDFLTKKCKYYGCDISKESIELIKENYSNKPKLTLFNDSFDNINEFTNKKFDLIYSFYALYYTNNLYKLLQNIYSHLKKDGVLWIVMPYKNTNHEIFTLLNQIYKIDSKVMYSIDGFSNDVIGYSSKIGFKNIDISLFENKIEFNKKKDLLTYIENTTFYEKKYAKDINEIITRNFNTNFQLTKEVISIKLTK